MERVARDDGDLVADARQAAQVENRRLFTSTVSGVGVHGRDRAGSTPSSQTNPPASRPSTMRGALGLGQDAHRVRRAAEIVQRVLDRLQRWHGRSRPEPAEDAGHPGTAAGIELDAGGSGGIGFGSRRERLLTSGEEQG